MRVPAKRSHLEAVVSKHNWANNPTLGGLWKQKLWLLSRKKQDKRQTHLLVIQEPLLRGSKRCKEGAD